MTQKEKLKYAYFHPTTKIWSSLDPPLPEQTEFQCVGQAIATCLQEHSTKVLFVEFNTGKEITGQEILDKASQIALTLHDLGIGQQEVIFDYLPSTILHVCSYIATQLLGCIKSGLAFKHPKRELLASVKRTGASVLTCYSGNQQVAEEVADEVDTVKLVIVADESVLEETTTKAGKRVIPISHFLSRQPKDSDPQLPILVDGRTAIAGALQSSGTTGTPKGIFRGHQNILPYVRREPTVQVLHTPFNYLSGFNRVMLTIFAGGKTVLIWDFDLKEWLEATQKYRVTSAFLSPAHLTLLAKSDLTPQYDLSSLKFIAVGGAAVSYGVIQEFKKVTGVPVVIEVYGSTELGLPLLPVPTEGFTCAGKPAPGVELRILQGDQFVGPGCEGEVCVRSYDVAPNIRDIADCTIDGFVKSGDLGYFNPDGLLLIVGRVKEMIKVSLHQVAPKELEDILLSHGEVEEAAVVGVPNDVYGQVPVAFVKPKSGSLTVREDELIKLVNSQVADYEKLAELVIVNDNLPKISFGKIDKRKLIEMYQGDGKV